MKNKTLPFSYNFPVGAKGSVSCDKTVSFEGLNAYDPDRNEREAQGHGIRM
jgi:hypothetical protein